jgi:hypothetical protein
MTGSNGERAEGVEFMLRMTGDPSAAQLYWGVCSLTINYHSCNNSEIGGVKTTQVGRIVELSYVVPKFFPSFF